MILRPTVFHITHPKAGSQWVAEVLKLSAPRRFIIPKERVAHLREDPFRPGSIYPTVYLPRPVFEAVLERCDPGKTPSPGVEPGRLRKRLRDRMQLLLRRPPAIRFIVIRDLRDTLISLYFGLKVNQPIYHQHRELLQSLDEEQGLLFLMEKALPGTAEIQRTWMGDPTLLLIRYEELVEDEQSVFERIIDHCRIAVDRKRLREIVFHNSFEKMTGRKRGQEDIHIRLRKGMPGDWRNHFTPRVTQNFKERFGRVLMQTGYEKDLEW